MKCYWCGAGTDLEVAIVPGHGAVHKGEQVRVAPRIVPRCEQCARRQAKHRAAYAQARYLRDAQLADAEQLGLDV